MASVKKTCFDAYYGGTTVHLEPRKGDRKSARDYCTKEASRCRIRHGFSEGVSFEYGVFVRDGKPLQVTHCIIGERSDLHSLKEDIKNGKSDEFLLEHHTSNFARYGKFVDRCRAICRESRIGKYRPVTVWWLWGEPGTGKSTVARDWLTRRAGGYFRITQEDNRGSGGVWWSGYGNEKGLLIDDLNPNAEGQIWLAQDTLLTILDHYAFRGQSKGNYCVLDFTHIVVTSNSHPSECNIRNYPALTRRLWRITKLLVDDSLPTRPDPVEDESKLSDFMSISP